MATVIGALKTKPYIRHFSSDKGLGKTLVFRPKTEATKEAILKAAFYMQGDSSKYVYGTTGLKWVNVIEKGKRSDLLSPTTSGKTNINSLSFVVACCRYAGITKAKTCNSFADLRDKLEQAKKLEKQEKVASKTSLHPGDILIRPKSENMSGYGCIYVGRTTRTSVIPKDKTSSDKKQQSNEKKEDLGEFAKKFCWPSVKGDSNPKGKWPSGKPYNGYKEIIEAIQPKMDIKIKQYRAGASCDAFVCAVCRAYGISNFPIKLRLQRDYFFRSDKYKKYFTKVKTTKGSTKEMKSGDIVCRLNNSHDGGKGHILIVCYENGHKRTANAHFRKGPGYYGVIDGFSGKDKNKHGNYYYGVFRLKPGVTLGDGTTAGAGAGGSDGDVVMMDDGSALVLKDSIKKLFSTERYKWVPQEEEKEDESEKRTRELSASLKDFLSNINVKDPNLNYKPPKDVELISMVSSKKSVFKAEQYKGKEGGSRLTSYPNLVQAPFIELSFNGVTIGGWGNTGDKYPNYITSLSVKKINGQINTYTIGLNYQVRPGEDPNFIEGLLGKVGYTNPLVIRYGDVSSPNLIFREEHAVVTDVKYKEDVSSSSISYTISAMSSITSADQSSFSFKQVEGKPSTVINDLLFGNTSASMQLKQAFPAMTREFISVNNLIPTTDSSVVIGGVANVSPITYLSHLVSCMSNSFSSYFLTFHDDNNGAYFKISEVKKTNSNEQSGLYEINVGYPDDNFISDFQLCNDFYWPLVYEYNGQIPRYSYTISNTGEVIKTKNENGLYSDNEFMEYSIINENWWKSITEFPVTAKVVLKGLTSPVMLMTYIKVNTLFYGQKDIASGLYVVTDQEDSVSGNGCTTTLTMLRVGE